MVQECQIAAGQNHLFDLVHQSVVFRVEHAVDGGEGDVFIAPTVTGDVVEVEQFVVVGAGRLGRGGGTHGGVGIGHLASPRGGVVGDVIEEGVRGAQRACGAHRGQQVALQQRTIQQHQLGKAVDTGDEVAVQIGVDQRHVGYIGIHQVDPHQGARLGLHFPPVGDGAWHCPIQQFARAAQPAGLHGIGPQEHLVGGVGGVSLVLIDPGGGDVVVGANVVGRAAHSIGPGVQGRNRRPGKHHEIGAAAHDVAGIIRIQGDDHTAAAALGDQIQTVIEELAENGEPGVVGSR